MTSEEFIKVFGRFMFGKLCISVYLENSFELWNLARSIEPHWDIPAPFTDDLGKTGAVAYWPYLKWPEERED